MPHFSLCRSLKAARNLCVVDFIMWEGHGRLCRAGSRDRQPAGTRQLRRSRFLCPVLTEWCGLHGSSGKPVSDPALHGHASLNCSDKEVQVIGMPTS